ncbi:hypothetical protein VPHK251G3_0089 [Vibrio phage K251 g3]
MRLRAATLGYAHVILHEWFSGGILKPNKAATIVVTPC